MLSYRHGFHAGNHADVFKHIGLTLLVTALLKKSKPFFYLDTHSGAGRYHLGSEMATKNREFESGIQRIWNEKSPPIEIQGYLDAVHAANKSKDLTWYPGSPSLVRHFLRDQDRMHLCELHPNDFKVLGSALRGDSRIRVEHTDGYQALKALIPPPERRGLVHIDPAFELKEERARLLQSVSESYRKWSTGIFAIWYPIQDRATATDFLKRFSRLGITKVVHAELTVLDDQPFRLNVSGLIIINPPWQFDLEMQKVLPWLWQHLSLGGQGQWQVNWLSKETASKDS